MLDSAFSFIRSRKRLFLRIYLRNSVCQADMNLDRKHHIEDCSLNHSHHGFIAKCMNARTKQSPSPAAVVLPAQMVSMFLACCGNIGPGCAAGLISGSTSGRGACLIATTEADSCPDLPHDLMLPEGNAVVGSLDLCNVRAVDGEVLMGASLQSASRNPSNEVAWVSTWSSSQFDRR